jgi:endonuclease/exonuclease/phosphatase (EEP) superfamily protein YafD
LSIHEVTPDWDQWLRDSLSGVYPYHHTYVDIGLFGIAIYARYPLKQIDTFYYQEIPNLKGCIQVGEEELCFVSVHTEPALNSYSLKRLQQHLSRVASESRSMGGHTVVMGEFNAVSWSGEIQTFMDSTGLLESRVGFMQQPVSLLDIPLDHIFFSRNLQCIDFRSVKSPSSRHLGILGVYQFRQFLYHAKKTAQ